MTMRQVASAALVICGSVAIAGAGKEAPRHAMPAAVRTVVVLTDPALTTPARHGVDALEGALRAKHVIVSEDATQIARADVVVLAGLTAGTGPAARALRAMNAQAPSSAESLTIRSGVRYDARPAVVLAGGDGVGLMYAALDTADRIGWATDADPFVLVRDMTEQPFLEKRGVVIFTMNRAYFESRLFDTQYLARFLDMFARDRINQLVVTFGYEHGGYMAPPYPYFFDVDGFQDVKVVGLTAEQQARNRAAFRTMLQMAAARGVKVKVGIWDHIYRAGV